MRTFIIKLFSNRFTYMILVGIIISILLHTIQPPSPNFKNGSNNLLATILITIFIWEGNLLLDKRINSLFSWNKNPIIRIVIQAIINIVYTAGIIYFGLEMYNNYVCELPIEAKQKMLSTSIIIGGLVSLLLLSTEISTQFFRQWKLSLIEIEKYKKENAEAQFQVLKSQINPHFLFNNLSVLSSLVYKDQDKAVEFINQFSKVYRYVMEQNSKELVEIETEMNFIKSYCFLLNIRFGDSFIFKNEINKNCLKKLIPPMSLQILIENTIKHNEVSSENPLYVNLNCDEEYLIVSNNLQLRKVAEPSSGMGLNNIKSRFKHFSSKEVTISNFENKFIVKLPLINAL